jgi:DNA gyrase/topoisomerase IV subunit A
MERDLIVIVTKRGMILKFDAAKVPERNRYGKGVGGIKLKDDDEVVGVVNVVEVDSASTPGGAQ